ncbi:methyltransferase domain-containing protein [Amycolatopsis sp. K13G38]|uniref:Methyltransferase domain-containing protein n=1 Tax=Amycolatopsis acididurans TaxID=2724524 RepID=A0ABX1JHF9_9PSEU|nr:methyltransferase domain-containing protein [Amycolatopsis acididurans]NKQ59174.1 methyltransferase domain-containing protein [Amycolatopsis acididurans]
MTVRDLQAVWEKLGSEDPLWAVLSVPGRKGGQWDLTEFMATGAEHVEYINRLLDEYQISLGDRVLDFGCGVGRLTQALAGQVGTLVGVDIAESMVEAARRINTYPDRVSYEHYDGHVLPFPDDSFDSAVTLIVLQHIPPAVQLSAMLELHRVVRPGGLLLFQVPAAMRSPEPLAVETCRAEITFLEGPETMRPLSSATVRARVTNRGPAPWPADQEVKLGNRWCRDGMRTRDDGRAELPRVVLPGETLELELTVRAPAEPGTYDIELDMVQEFVAWWSEHDSPTARRAVAVEAAAEPKTFQAAPTAVTSAARARPETEGIEMHPMPTSLVRAVFDHVGAEMVGVDEYAIAGPEWVSRTYLVRVGG